MTAGSDPRIEHYRRMQLGYQRVLALRIEQVPHELGEPCQAVVIELLKPDVAGKAVLTFTGVQDLKVGRIHPGCICGLQIESVEADQLEGLRYRVFNGEQDLTLSLLCKSFDISERAL